MTASAEAPLFENGDWCVRGSGLEHKDTGYFIGRDLIGDRRDDGLWSWPVHMAEKTWVRADSFAQAFRGAIEAFDLVPDAALDASFAAGQESAGGWLPPPAGPDAIRVPGSLAREPELPAWALPDGPEEHAGLAGLPERGPRLSQDAAISP